MTSLLNQVRDELRRVEGMAPHTVIKERLGNVPDVQIISCLETLVEHKEAKREELPGRRRVYQFIDGSKPVHGRAPLEKGPTMKARILAALCVTRDWTDQGIADCIGAKLNSVSALLWRLRKSGDVVSEKGRGVTYWSLTKPEASAHGAGCDGAKRVTSCTAI